MASIASERHHALIDGLTRLYDTLVAMQYISAADIMHPPHSPDSMALNRLQQLGFDPEAVELAGLLPALRNELTWGWQEEGTQLLPRAKAVNYFAQRPGSVGEDQMDELRLGDRVNGEHAKQLPSWLLRLTRGGDYGCHLLYDTRNQSIVEWYIRGRAFPDDHPGRPAADVLFEIIARFSNLEWVPYFDASSPNPSRSTREIVENPLVLQSSLPGQQHTVGSDLTDFATAIRLAGQPMLGHQQQHPLMLALARDSLRGRINRWRALQKLYRDCGWGSPAGFDAARLVQRRAQWTADLRILEREYTRDGPSSRAHVTNSETAEQCALRESITQRWEAFWVATAGDAVV